MQRLKRGTQIGNTTVRKLFAQGENWDLYVMGNDSYSIAITDVLFNLWTNQNNLPRGLFSKHESGMYVLNSNVGYLISSLQLGPFPESSSQIEAFAIAFSTAKKINSDIVFEEAIYIEEYSLILPTKEDGQTDSDNICFGRWITGGVGISTDNVEQLIKLMSWMPEKVLVRSLDVAGVNKQDYKTREESDNIASEECDLPEERFTLTGRKKLETFLNDNIIDVLRKRDEYKRMGIDFPGATILYGPPGSGKTFAIEKLAAYLGWERFDINSNSIGSPYIHETGKKIAEVFDAAISVAPSIIIIDEMEAYLSSRSGREDHHVEEVAEFLRKIPEAISHEVLVFAMTNLIDTIDPAILRRGRFDYIIEVPMANKDEIRELLVSRMKELPVSNDVNIEEMAEKLENRPLSDITFVLREAGKTAVRLGKKEIGCNEMELAIDQLPDKKTIRRKIGFNND